MDDEEVLDLSETLPQEERSSSRSSSLQSYHERGSNYSITQERETDYLEEQQLHHEEEPPADDFKVHQVREDEDSENQIPTKRKKKVKKKKKKTKRETSVDQTQKEHQNQTRSYAYEPVDPSDLVNPVNEVQEVYEQTEQQSGMIEANETDQSKLSLALESKIHVKSIRQKGVFVENPSSGQFRRMQNAQAANEELNRTSDNEDEEDDQFVVGETDRINREIQISLHTMQSNLYFFLEVIQGLLGGSSLTLALICLIPAISDMQHFVIWYSPFAQWCEKLYLITIAIALFGSLYILLNELIPIRKRSESQQYLSFFSTLPNPNKFRKFNIEEEEDELEEKKPGVKKGSRIDTTKTSVRLRILAHFFLGFQVLLYTVMFYVTLGNLIQDDYFNSKYQQSSTWYEKFFDPDLHDNTSQFKKERKVFVKRVILWHIINMIRAICAIICWILTCMHSRINKQLQSDSESALFKLRIAYDLKLQQIFELEARRLQEEELAYYYPQALPVYSPTNTNKAKKE